MPNNSDAVPVAPSAFSWLLLGAPVVAWSAQELVSFYVTASRCTQGQATVPRAALLDVSLLALVTTVAASIASVRRFQRLTKRSVTQIEGREPDELLALASVVLGVVLTLGVIWGALPAVLVSHVCEGGA